uniref:Tectonic family member 2 n=1 Tax=Podarcis muralis TaxID=64176 RepID=A0A670JZ06_PODMU
MSGPVVTASLVSNPSDVFSIAVADNETGKILLTLLFPQINVSRVMVSLTRSLQLCTSNLTNCCTEALCLVEALQVSACRDSVVVAHLLIQAEIYANTTLHPASYFTTVIPSQVFQPLGSCPCNLTAGACDIRCCCDLECTSEMKQLFNGSCFKGIFGGDVSPPFDQLCSVQTGNSAPDWFPFLCVQSSISNTPFRGYFYHGAVSSPRVSSFKVPLQTIPGKLSSGYRQGDPVMTVQNGYFTVPQVMTACMKQCEGPLVHGINGTHQAPKSGFWESPSVTPLFPKHIFELLLWYSSFSLAFIVYPFPFSEILTQKFTVNFVSVNTTSREELSGNPGEKPHWWYLYARQRKCNIFVMIKYFCYIDGKGLCASAGLTPILFGLNSISGCILEVDLKDNCNQLRENVTKRLNSLVQATHVGKRGNSSTSAPDDWVEIIYLDTFGGDTNASFGDLKGICLDIPTHLNIQIITADVGAVEGIPQQEIVGVQVSISTVTWQVQCPIACEDKASSLSISAAVQFIKIPAQPPVPKTRFQINYTEYDCKRNDVCWPELLYPLTRYYTGEPYSQTLAKGLMLIFFILVAAVLSDPWRRIHRARNKR